MMTNATGAMPPEQDIEYHPYGEQQVYADTLGQQYKFTGHEHDTETNDDYFGARYYASAFGRFLTADWAATPVPVPYAVLANPQTLNLYAYVQNNPITGTDPDGHAPEFGGVEFAEDSGTESSTSAATQDVSYRAFAAVIPSSPPPQEKNEPTAQNQTTGRQPDGSYVAPTGPGSEIAKIDAAADAGKPVALVGSGECVALTSHLTGVTDQTTRWKAGQPVVFPNGTVNPDVKPGTAVATFDANGNYPRGNVAKNSGVVLGPGLASGKGSIRLMDQWNAHPPNPANPPQSRDVRFYSDPTANVSNNSNAYYVILVPR